MNMNTSMTPGRNPAMKSRAIETSATKPYTMSMIEGGISRPRVPDPASVQMVMRSS